VKRTLIVSIAPFALMLFFLSCNGRQAPQVTIQSTTAPAVVSNANQKPEVQVVDAIAELNKPSSLDDRFSYTYGYMIYSTLMAQPGISGVDAEYFAKGALDAASSSGFFTQEEMTQTLYEVQTKMLAIAQKEVEELAASNLKAAEDFLAVNKGQEGVKVTDSGLQYKVLVQGNGSTPTEQDMVEVDYKMMLLDGQLIDSSYERGHASTFQLQAIQVPGFIEGVKLMSVGSKYRFWIHPDLGYGKEGSQTVEPDALLVVEVELKSVQPHS